MLTSWERLKLFYHLLTDVSPIAARLLLLMLFFFLSLLQDISKITEEDIEKMKRSDIISVCFCLCPNSLTHLCR